MEFINVPTINGTIREQIINVEELNINKNDYECIKKRNGGYYYNIPCTFDIEATTIEPPQSEGDYVFTPYGFMYQWQFCIDDIVVFGRTWEEFQELINKLVKSLHLDKNKKLVIYVHNLAYEFQFIKEFIEIDSVFAKDKRKPMKVNTVNGIEFRCSYFLSNMSLIKFCENTENVIHYKLTDEYDYSKLRTPETPLTEIEKAYCYNDVRGLSECIAQKIYEEGDITKIPLTNTGYVRREYRISMNDNSKNRDNFLKTKLNAKQYTMLKKAFRGGNTHAYYKKANKILNNVYSYDIQSSYPSSMMLDDFPIGKFMFVNIDEDIDKFEYYLKNFCCVIDVTFCNIELDITQAIPYIDIAHCEERQKILNDNGRVLKAEKIRITCTNIDFEIIENTYNYEKFKINKMMYSEKGKLPFEFRKKLLHFYENKTKLKGVEGKEYEYMKSKNMVNSSYGMTVTDICHSEIFYDDELMTWEEISPNINDALNDFYKSRNNFLPYQWGVFVTANARKRLQIMLNKVGKDVVYLDTDSIKFQNKKHLKEFEKLNKQLIEQAENNDIKAYAIKDNKKYYLGIWDYEGMYKKFKTLGAKKYCFVKEKNGVEKFEVTVSGMSKKKGAKVVKNVDNFVIGKTFSDIGRTTSWYNDDKIHTINVNGCSFTTASNIGILETTYTLGVTNEYYDLINNSKEYY